MSDAPDGPSRLPLIVGVIALAGVGVWWLLSDEDPGSGESPQTVDASEAETRRGGGESGGAGPVEDEPPPDDETEGYDPERYARMIFDGGLPPSEEGAAPYDPPAAPEPTTGTQETIEVAMARNDARRAAQEQAAEDEAPRPPPAPSAQLRQATFWRGMLERRIETLQSQLEGFEASGDERRAATARRLIERLQEQRPSVERRIEELQQEAIDEAEGQ